MNNTKSKVYIWFKDASENVSKDPLTYIFFYDTTRPKIKLTSPTKEEAYTYKFKYNTITFKGYVFDEGGSGVTEVSYIIKKSDGQTYDGGSASLDRDSTTKNKVEWKFENKSFAQDTSKITVNATDKAGNNAEDTLDITYSSDTEAPKEGGITIKTTSPTSSKTISVSLSAKDNTGVVGYYLYDWSASEVIKARKADDSGWTKVTSAAEYKAELDYSLKSSGDGNKTVYVWYKDAAGNVSSVSSAGINLDTKGLKAVITSPKSSSTITAKSLSLVVKVNAKHEDTGSLTWNIYKKGETTSSLSGDTTSWDDKVNITEDAVKKSKWTDTVDLSSLSAGYYTLEVTVTDTTGNKTPVKAENLLYKTDTELPQGVQPETTTFYTNKKDVTFDITGKDNGGSLKYYVSQETTQDGPAKQPKASATGWDTCYVDNVYHKADNDTGPTYYYRQDSVKATLNNPVNNTKSKVYIWFKDASENVSKDPLTYIFFYDTTRPKIKLTSPTKEEAYTYKFKYNTITFKGYVFDEGGSGVTEVSYIIKKSDGQTYDGGSASLDRDSTTKNKVEWKFENKSFAQDTSKITVNATDKAGNNAEDTLDITYSSDTEAPKEGGITIKTTSPTSSKTISVSLSAKDNTGVVGYYLYDWSASEVIKARKADDSGWTKVTSAAEYKAELDYSLKSSGDGNKTVYVWYKDAAGNVSSVSSAGINLDTKGLKAVITSPKSSSTITAKSLSLVVKVNAKHEDTGSLTWNIYKKGETTSSLSGDTTSWDDKVNITEDAVKKSKWTDTVDLSSLSAGYYTLEVTVTDTTGNKTPVKAENLLYKTDTTGPIGKNKQ